MEGINNPTKALDAVVNPSPLTLSRIALLEKIKAPILGGDISSFAECCKAVYAVFAPLKDVVSNLANIELAALEFVDGYTIDEYQAKVIQALEGVVRFYEMLPRPEAGDGEKKI